MKDHSVILHILGLLMDILVTFPEDQLKAAVEAIFDAMQMADPLVRTVGLKAINGLFVGRPDSSRLSAEVNALIINVRLLLQLVEIDNLLFYCSSNRLIDWLIDWLIEWLIDWLIDWLSDWVSDWLIDWLELNCRRCMPRNRQKETRKSFCRGWRPLSRPTWISTNKMSALSFRTWKNLRPIVWGCFWWTDPKFGHPALPRWR